MSSRILKSYCPRSWIFTSIKFRNDEDLRFLYYLQLLESLISQALRVLYSLRRQCVSHTRNWKPGRLLKFQHTNAPRYILRHRPIFAVNQLKQTVVRVKSSLARRGIIFVARKHSEHRKSEYLAVPGRGRRRRADYRPPTSR